MPGISLPGCKALGVLTKIAFSALNNLVLFASACNLIAKGAVVAISVGSDGIKRNVTPAIAAYFASSSPTRLAVLLPISGFLGIKPGRRSFSGKPSSCFLIMVSIDVSSSLSNTLSKSSRAPENNVFLVDISTLCSSNFLLLSAPENISANLPPASPPIILPPTPPTTVPIGPPTAVPKIAPYLPPASAPAKPPPAPRPACRLV